jgi:cytochrome o ubiquinol oxidase operon protein cyoD
MNKPIVQPEENHGSLSSYALGYIVSIGLTIIAYLLVTHHVAGRDVLIGLAATLALIQFIAQLLFFLHLGTETKPRWKLMVFSFMLLVVAILVFGSIWIMSNLNYHMTQTQINNYLNSQDGL